MSFRRLFFFRCCSFLDVLVLNFGAHPSGFLYKPTFAESASLFDEDGGHVWTGVLLVARRAAASAAKSGRWNATGRFEFDVARRSWAPVAPTARPPLSRSPRTSDSGRVAHNDCVILLPPPLRLVTGEIVRRLRATITVARSSQTSVFFSSLSCRCESSFSDVSHVSAPRSSTLQITLRTGSQLQFFTHKAVLIHDLIHRFANEAEKVSSPTPFDRSAFVFYILLSTARSFRYWWLFFFTSFNRLSLIDWRRRFICSTPSRLPGGREKKCCFFSFTPPPSYPFPSSDASLNYSSFPKMRVSTVCVCVCVCVSARESGSVRVGGRATWIGFYWEQVGVISRLDRCLIFTEFFFPLFCGCSTCCIKLNRGTCCVFFCFAVRYRKLQGVVFDQVQCNFLLWHFYFRAWFYNCRKFLSDAPSRIPLPPIHWIEWHSFADYFSFMDILFVRASPIEQYTFILLLWFLFIPFHFIFPSSLTVMLHHPISWSIHHEPHSDWVVWVLFVQLIELNGAFLNSNHGFPPVGRLMTFDIRRENYHVLNDGRFFFNGFLKNFLAIPFQQLNRCSLKAQRLFNARMKSFCWEFLRTEWMNTSLANREIPFEIFRNNRKAFNFKLSPLKWQQDDER